MVARVARLHLQRETWLGAARVAGGWTIALLGLALLVAGAIDRFGDQQAALSDALLGGAMAAAATALGAAPLLVTGRVGPGTRGALLGFGAGVMLAASVFSLLLPGFDAARAQGLDVANAGLVVAAGLVAGAIALAALDRALPHTHEPDGSRGAGAVWLFVFAIAVHNIPEGLAIGVATGGSGTGNAVATGISLQNVPEGLIVALALASAGYRRPFAFVVAALSGLIEPLAAIVGSLTIAHAEALLPWALAGAAGAMLFVLGHEIIPESRRGGHETLARVGLIGGFVAMIVMDALLA